MYLDAKQWLHSLNTQAQALALAHLDLLIDGSVFSDDLRKNLTGLEPLPVQALLFEHTPEQAIATQGPILVRLQWSVHAHQWWLDKLIHQRFKSSGVLALFSRWDVASLAAHLGGCTQAHWGRGANNGILRYYDSCLFHNVCEALNPDQRRQLHAPVIKWLWLDRDGRARTLVGDDTEPAPTTNVPPAFTLSDEQVAYLQAWSSAEQWHKAAGRHPFASLEAWLQHLFEGHLAAGRERVSVEGRESFVRQWLITHAPRTPFSDGKSL